MMMQLKAEAQLHIQRPIAEVYEAIVNPVHMTQYFIGKSSGKMETNAKLIWEFSDFPGEFPVEILEIIPFEKIVFSWDPETTVTILLSEKTPTNTHVQITEGNKTLTEENIQWLVGNTFGWGNFLDCLKAYLEYGIQLRKGAF